MSFPKAVQNRPVIEGQREYIEAHSLYRVQCSLNAKIVKALEIRLAVNPSDTSAELQLYRHRAAFSQQCKTYLQAKAVWNAQQIRHKVGTNGLTTTVFTLTDIAAITETQLANTTSELLEMRRKDVATMQETPEFEHIKSALEEAASKRLTVKEQFTTQAERKSIDGGSSFAFDNSNDPTLGDFEPL